MEKSDFMHIIILLYSFNYAILCTEYVLDIFEYFNSKITTYPYHPVCYVFKILFFLPGAFIKCTSIASEYAISWIFL